MNELVISTYIQIMQDGLVEHSTQEAAGRFILEAVSKDNETVQTDLGSKKISRLVSRKDPVPDDIKRSALKPEIVEKIRSYFRTEVLPDINQFRKYDVFEKIMNVIIQDVQIAKKQKDIFQNLYDSDEEVEFLVATFLYALQRNNKIVDDKVETQDAPLLGEVNYECPISHTKLVEEIKGIPTKKYEVIQIYPDDLSPEQESEFDAIYAKPENLDDPSNLIAVSMDTAERYMMKPTVDEYRQLVEIKQSTSRKYSAMNAINRIDLEEEIRIALDALTTLTASKDLLELEYEALRIDEKVDDLLLQKDIQNHVVSYYRYIEKIFSEEADNFDEIASEVKLSSQKLEKAGLSQEDVIESLTEWIRHKAFVGGDKGKLACRIVVCFFIQNCEVFYK